MSLMGKLVTKAVVSKYFNSSLHRALNKPILQPSMAYSSDKCGSGKKDSDSSKSKGGEGYGNPRDPCDPWCCSPCPGDSPSAPEPSSAMYDSRKYGHTLPTNNVNCLMFEPLPHIPTGVFRNTDCEMLGLGAGKCCFYKNPEYFSYHHMSYYDMHLTMRCFRKPSPNSNRKP